MPGKTQPAKLTKKRIFTHQFDVVGLNFRMKREARQTLAATCQRAANVGGVNVKLVREQENKYDVNAIRVIHDGGGELRGKHLGYLRADTAALIAPLLDEGTKGGLVFQDAKLVKLYLDDDCKTGVIVANFKDYRR